MSYLEQLRDRAAQKKNMDGSVLPKLTKPPSPGKIELPKLTEVGCVSFAGSGTPLKKPEPFPTTGPATVAKVALPKLTEPVGCLDSLPVYTRVQRQAIMAAREAAPLLEFREGLTYGRLRLCANCQHFTFAVNPADLGQCRQFGESAPFVPAPCEAYAVSANPAAPRYLPDPDGARAREYRS